MFLICLSRLQEVKTRQKLHVSPSAVPPRKSEKVGVRRGGSEGDCEAPTSNRGRENEATDDGVFGPKLAKRPSIQPHRFKPARRKFSNRFTTKKQLKSGQKSAASKSLNAPNALTQDSGDMETAHDQDNGGKFEVRGEALSDVHNEQGKRYGIRQ
jgi:hypothetical protein